MFKILAISGDGVGAGKSTLATRLGDEVWSLAGALREELARLYPHYSWFNKTQRYKAETIVKEYKRGDKSVRDVMIEYGEERCKVDPCYFVRLLADKMEATSRLATGLRSVAIDDLRKVVEIDYLKGRFGDKVQHYHIVNPDAVPEAHFQNDALRDRADYVMQWKRVS